jgi:transposase InsO family protein
MAPLYRLTSLKGDLKWKPENEDTRQKVISILTSDPVLMIFDPQHQVELHTDASSLGYGGILFQVVNGKRHVVAYFSKRTSPAESKYHSYELETLAVVNSIKHFRQYLQGRNFTVVTDCNSLKSSQTKHDLTPRAHRWWAFLQAYDFSVVYREGKKMSHVDFFSRNPLPFNTKQLISRVEQKRIDFNEVSPNWLQAEQQRDDEISKIVRDLESNHMDEEIAKTYVLRSGVLYRKIQRNGRNKCLPYLPRALRWSVVNNFHDSLVHLGADKTCEKLYDFYWFPGMAQYVKKFVNSCITCKVAKPHSGKVQAELHPIPKVTTPWHTVHIDATGKLSGKNDNKEYVFVLIDAFTKYVLLFHTTNIDSKSSIRAVNHSVSLFGAPTRIIADQGRCFASKEFRDFCDSKNINLHLIATGSSRANGQVERVMSVLKSMLTAVETSADKSWQDALGEVQLAINCTMNRVTRASPLELLIGKVARPLSLMCSDDFEIEVDIDQVREVASENIQRCAEYDKSRFDTTKATIRNFSVGDFVLLENEERNQTKLDPKFKGPFKVVDVLAGDRYTLKALNSNRTYKYAHDRLRRMPVSHVPVEVDVEVDRVDE